MYVKNGYYKVENHKEYYKMPANTNKRKKVKQSKQEKESNTNITYHYNLLNFITAFVIGAFAPLPIEWKAGLIIAVLAGGMTASIEE